VRVPSARRHQAQGLSASDSPMLAPWCPPAVGWVRGPV
jgi:hypothetical protein